MGANLNSISQVMSLLLHPGNEEKILALRPDPEVEARMESLRKKMYNQRLTSEELREVNDYLSVTGLIQYAQLKIMARRQGVLA